MKFRLLLAALAAISTVNTLPAQNVGPVSSAVIGDRTVYTTGQVVLDLMNFFTDPDANFDVRMTTTSGDIDLDLFESATPRTVENFLKYVDERRYFRQDPVISALAPSFVHRSVPNFIIQGGGFIATRQSSAQPNRVTPTAVDGMPPIPNEPGVSNTRGTIAMAKLATDPNSATSQWFINLANNGGTPPNGLDFQNGGFTAFGQVVNNGMTVADAIAGLPRYNFGGAFTELPLYNPPNGNLKFVDMVTLPQIRRPLSFTASDNNSAVVDARISGTKLILQGLAAGSAPVTVTATDLNGAQTMQVFNANVQVGPPRFANISTRAEVGTGDNVLIGGFILGGSTTPRRLLIRGLGPALAAAGLSGTLVNPTLELRNGSGGLIDSNDDWGFSKDEQAIIDSGLAPGNAAESAIVATLPSSNAGTNYTALMRGASNGTGLGLIEIYDLDASPGPRLLNISTRGLVGEGDKVMIGGLIVSGSSSQKIILRGLGPTLAAAGVSGTLSDPFLQLRDGQGNVLESNDDWGNSPDAAELTTSGFAPGNAKEAAFINVRPPGQYTFILSGAGNAPTGVALVEAYAADND